MKYKGLDVTDMRFTSNTKCSTLPLLGLKPTSLGKAGAIFIKQSTSLAHE